jgi:hypothetical protein
VTAVEVDADGTKNVISRAEVAPEDVFAPYEAGPNNTGVLEEGDEKADVAAAVPDTERGRRPGSGKVLLCDGFVESE